MNIYATFQAEFVLFLAYALGWFNLEDWTTYFEGTPSFKPVLWNVIVPNVLVQSRTIEPAKKGQVSNLPLHSAVKYCCYWYFSKN